MRTYANVIEQAHELLSSLVAAEIGDEIGFPLGQCTAERGAPV